MFMILDNLFSKKDIGPLELRVDMHSHLIPGIDDGSKTMLESIVMILRLKELGYSKIITTPHIMKHRYPNSSEVILNGLNALRDELHRRNIDIIVEAAAEYFLDEHFLELLDKKDILTLHGNYVLFEMSYMMQPAILDEILYQIEASGYVPVLAHPERYRYMHSDFYKYARLKKRGVLFQVNINSLGGFYSQPVQKVAEKLMESGMVDFLGSDAHSSRHLDMLAKTMASHYLHEVAHKNKILNNTLI